MLLRLVIKRLEKDVGADSRTIACAVAGQHEDEDEEVEDYRSRNPVYR